MSTITSEASPVPKTRYPHQWPRISLAQLLVLVALVAAVMGFFVQSRHLANARAALSRYESTQIPTSLADDQFRIIVRTIVDTDDVKVVTYRVETAIERFATLQGASGSNGKSLNRDPKTGLYFTEIPIVFDHLSRASQMKVSCMGMGSIQKDVPADYSLDGSVIINDVNGVYDLTDTVNVFDWDGITYSLSLK